MHFQNSSALLLLFHIFNSSALPLLRMTGALHRALPIFVTDYSSEVFLLRYTNSLVIKHSKILQIIDAT